MYCVNGNSSWYIDCRPLFGGCPLLGVSVIGGSTVASFSHASMSVVERYRDGVCSLLFHLLFIICHPYIPKK